MPQEIKQWEGEVATNPLIRSSGSAKRDARFINAPDEFAERFNQFLDPLLPDRGASEQRFSGAHQMVPHPIRLLARTFPVRRKVVHALHVLEKPAGVGDGL